MKHLPRPVRLAQEQPYFHTTPEPGPDRTRDVLAAQELQYAAWPFYNPWEPHTPAELRTAAAALTAAADAWDAIPGRSYEAGHCRHEAARCLVKAGP
jgi:hypothetical protein